MPPPGQVIKTYPPRGPLQQFRLLEAAPFTCFRCGQDKKSKLQSVYAGDWSRALCNGCYGRLLSLYEIQAGTEPDDIKAERLAEQLVEMVSVADARDALRRAVYARDPEQCLTEDSLRFLGSSEHVAQALLGEDALEWSPAIIGLCKAVERELVERFLDPIRETGEPDRLSAEFDDPDLGALARWAAGRGKPPELGTLAHALLAAANSKRRVDTSVIIKAIREEAARWPRGGWSRSAHHDQ
jgi:hypothetical protein